MKLLTGLFRAARKRVMTTDNDMGMFRDKLNKLVEEKDTLQDDEVVKRVDELKEMTIDLPDDEEKAKLDRFLEEIRKEEYWCDFFYVEVMTGLRRGEICGLKWSDIDFDANKLRVQRSVSAKRGGGVVIGETKTNTGNRNITMPPSVSEILQRRKQRAITEWVFPAFLNPEQPIHPEAAYRKLKVILKHAELPLIRFHDLRHTFATHAMKGGVDAKTLSGLLGHTDASFTLDTYTHVTSDMQKNASDVVGRMMQSFMRKD